MSVFEINFCDLLCVIYSGIAEYIKNITHNKRLLCSDLKSTEAVLSMLEYMRCF